MIGSSSINLRGTYKVHALTYKTVKSESATAKTSTKTENMLILNHSGDGGKKKRRNHMQTCTNTHTPQNDKIK